jgi:hypothetical protein
MSADRADAESTPRHIAPPRRGSAPEKVNVFTVMQGANCQLFPLFGHVYEGAIVSGGILFKAGLRGDPEHDPGLFYHQNSVDEVRLVMAASGCPIHAGDVQVAGRQHPVGGQQFSEPLEPDAFHIGIVTQRNTARQEESMSFRCEACRHLLFRKEYDSSPAATAERGHPCFATIADTADAVLEFNRRDDLRHCEKCGHQNPPFPAERWGWVTHKLQAEAAAAARRTLEAAADRARSEVG